MTDDDEPMVTLVVALRHEARTRYILARGGLHAAPLVVVADDAGRIPVFDTEAAARAHAARRFPTSVPGMEELAVTPVDLDRALEWAANPASRSAGPVELALVWEILSGAEAAPVMPVFDPMSLPMLHDRIRAGGPDAAVMQEIMTGMILSGMVSDARRRGLEDDAPWPDGSESIWTPENDAVLARVIRDGAMNLAGRLSRVTA